MFEDLRNAAGSDLFEEVEEDESNPFETFAAAAVERRFLGMTAAQRFIISLLLFGTVVVMGLTCLLVTGRVWPY